MPDEEWYVDPSTGEIYVYVRPDDKILPKWERVDVFAKSIFDASLPAPSQ
jgi:hypothetical protein